MPATVLRIFQDFVSGNRVSRPNPPVLKDARCLRRSADNSHCGAHVRDPAILSLLARRRNLGRHDATINRRRQRSRGLFRLRPVTFRYKQDPQRIRQYGLIAEDVANVFPELVTRGGDGAVESVQYHELLPMLLKARAFHQGQDDQGDCALKYGESHAWTLECIGVLQVAVQTDQGNFEFTWPQ